MYNTFASAKTRFENLIQDSNGNTIGIIYGGLKFQVKGDTLDALLAASKEAKDTSEIRVQMYYTEVEYISCAHANSSSIDPKCINYANDMDAILSGIGSGDKYHVPYGDDISEYADELGWIYYRHNGTEWIKA